jgi:hypothetical protein
MDNGIVLIIMWALGVFAVVVLLLWAARKIIYFVVKNVSQAQKQLGEKDINQLRSQILERYHKEKENKRVTDLEICQNCERTIGKLEQAYVYNNKIVCKECNARLRIETDGNNEKEKDKKPLTGSGSSEDTKKNG